jgi:hypothetical protein
MIRDGRVKLCVFEGQTCCLILYAHKTKYDCEGRHSSLLDMPKVVSEVSSFYSVDTLLSPVSLRLFRQKGHPYLLVFESGFRPSAD